MTINNLIVYADFVDRCTHRIAEFIRRSGPAELQLWIQVKSSVVLHKF